MATQGQREQIRYLMADPQKDTQRPLLNDAEIDAIFDSVGYRYSGNILLSAIEACRRVAVQSGVKGIDEGESEAMMQRVAELEDEYEEQQMMGEEEEISPTVESKVNDLINNLNHHESGFHGPHWTEEQLNEQIQEQAPAQELPVLPDWVSDPTVQVPPGKLHNIPSTGSADDEVARMQANANRDKIAEVEIELDAHVNPMEHVPDGHPTDTATHADIRQLIANLATDKANADDVARLTTVLNNHVNSPHDIDTLARQRLDVIEANGWVTHDRIGSKVVEQDNIAFNSIGRREIQQQEVTGGHLVDNILEDRHIPDDVIGNRHIAEDSISEGELQANSVGTPELKDGAVTEDKLAQAVIDQLGGGTGTPTDLSNYYTKAEVDQSQATQNSAIRNKVNVSTFNARNNVVDTALANKLDEAVLTDINNAIGEKADKSSIPLIRSIEIAPNSFTSARNFADSRIAVTVELNPQSPRLRDIRAYGVFIQGQRSALVAYRYAQGTYDLNIVTDLSNQGSKDNVVTSIGRDVTGFVEIYFYDTTVASPQPSNVIDNIRGWVFVDADEPTIPRSVWAAEGARGLTFTAEAGQQYIIEGTYYLTGTNNRNATTIELVRGTTVIESHDVLSRAGGQLPGIVKKLDTPGAGSHTYLVRIESGDTGTLADIVVEARKVG